MKSPLRGFFIGLTKQGGTTVPLRDFVLESIIYGGEDFFVGNPKEKTGNNCGICEGRGVLDIVESWHTLTVWCPNCEKNKFERAATVYQRDFGRDFRNTVYQFVENKMTG